MGSFIELKAGQIGIGRRYHEDGRTVATRLIAVDIDGKNVLQLVKPKQANLALDASLESANTRQLQADEG